MLGNVVVAHLHNERRVHRLEQRRRVGMPLSRCVPIRSQCVTITPQCITITPQYITITPQCITITPQCITPQCIRSHHSASHHTTVHHTTPHIQYVLNRVVQFLSRFCVRPRVYVVSPTLCPSHIWSVLHRCGDVVCCYAVLSCDVVCCGVKWCAVLSCGVLWCDVV